ncbi:O-antigen ligase family protein [candidate division WWE3 bacterium]|nr:O-antigen ligase family protein [candidate division WWE3 bacterium]
MKKIVVLLFNVFIVSVVLGQLTRLPLPGGSDGALLLQDLVLVALVASWVVWRVMGAKSFKINGLDIGPLFFIFVTFISLVYALSWTNLSEWTTGLFYWIRLSMYLSLFKITSDLVKDANYNPQKNLTNGGVTFAVIGLLQFLLFPDFSKYVRHGWDPHYYRVLSTFFDPNYAGLLLTFALLLILDQLYRRKTSIRQIMQFGIVGLATVLTFSRSTYLALITGFGLFGLIKDRRIILAMIIAGSLVIAAVPRVRDRVVGAVTVDETAQLRLISYVKTWQIIEDHPLLGVGFNTFRYAQEDYGYFKDQRGVPQESGHAGAGADNSFLFLWATGGLLSVLTLFGWFVGLFVSMWKNKYRALLLSTLCAFIIHAQFVNSFFFTGLLAWFLITTSYLLNQKEGKHA